MELVVLILVVIVVLLLLTRGGRYLGRLIVNGIIGVVLLFLTNLVLADDIPINEDEDRDDDEDEDRDDDEDKKE